ncbi:MAG: hypothetical protein IT208_15820 [Chthonomonadales bacterium]|nr:hypothetical protein [Chthonomonadales bacterium]
MNLTALLPLHPAWPAATAPVQAGPPSAAPPPVPRPAAVALPRPLPAPAPRPGAATSEMEVAIRPALRRLEALRDILNARSQRVLARERQAASRQAAADIRAMAVELRARTQALIEESRQESYDERIALHLTVLALASQARSLAGGPPELVQRQLEEARAAAAAAEARQAARDTAIRNQMAQALVDYREEREQAWDRRLAARQGELRLETNQTIAGYQAQVRQLASRPTDGALAPAPVPMPAARAVTRMPPPATSRGPVAALPLLPPPPAAGASDERRRLAAFIADDMRRRVRRIAARSHWAVTFDRRSGAPNRTAEVAGRLRQELAL